MDGVWVAYQEVISTSRFRLLRSSEDPLPHCLGKAEGWALIPQLLCPDLKGVPGDSVLVRVLLLRRDPMTTATLIKVNI